MTFTARERFIYHITAAMTMRGMRMIDDSKMRRIMSLILKNRCRSLTVDDVEQVYHDILVQYHLLLIFYTYFPGLMTLCVSSYCHLSYAYRA